MCEAEITAPFVTLEPPPAPGQSHAASAGAFLKASGSSNTPTALASSAPGTLATPRNEFGLISESDAGKASTMVVLGPSASVTAPRRVATVNAAAVRCEIVPRTCTFGSGAAAWAGKSAAMRKERTAATIVAAFLRLCLDKNLFSIWTRFTEPSTTRVCCRATNSVQTRTDDVAILGAVRAPYVEREI